MNIVEISINNLKLLERIHAGSAVGSSEVTAHIAATNESLVESHQIYDVLAERAKQDGKWGVQNHDPITWLAILTEEVGEFAQAALHHRFGGPASAGMREEAVQCAAVALAIVQCLDRHNGWLVRCAACERGDYQLGHADGCPQNAKPSRRRGWSVVGVKLWS